MENCFPRTSVAHCGRIDRKDYSILGEVVFHHDLVAAHPYICRNIVGFGRAHQGMEEKPIDGFQGTFLNVLVGPVNGVPGLEAHYRFPTPLLEHSLRRSRVNLVFGEQGMGIRIIIIYYAPAAQIGPARFTSPWS